MTVNIKNPITYLSFKSQKKNRSHTVLMTLLYTFTAFFGVFIVTLSSSSISSSDELLKDSFGIYDRIINVHTAAEMEHIKEECGNVGVIKSLGSCEVKGYSSGTLSVGRYDTNAAVLQRIKLTNGRLPNAIHEAVVEENVLNLLSKTINDTINILIDGNYVPFVLTGTVNSFSYFQWNSLSKETVMPSIFVSDDSSFSADNISYFCSVKGGDLEKITEGFPFADNQKSYFVSRNSIYYNNSNLPVFLIAVAFVVTTLMLICIFAIQKNEIRKRIGLLKIIGFTFKDTCTYYATEVLFEGGIGVVVGTVLGTLATYFIAQFKKTFITFNLNVPLLLIFVAIFFVAIMTILYLSLKKASKKSVVESFSPYEKEESPSENEVHIKTKKPILLWALKSIFVNKSHNMIVTPIFLSITLLSLGLFVSDMHLSGEVRKYDAADIIISIYDTSSIGGDLTIPTAIYSGMSKSDYEILRSMPEIENLVGVKYLECMQYGGNYTDYDASVSSDELVEEKVKYGYEENTTLYHNSISSTDFKTIKAVESYLIEGEINEENLSTGKEMLVGLNDYTINTFNKKVGDICKKTLLYVDTDGTVKKKDFDVRIGGILHFTKEDIESNKFARIFASENMWENKSFDTIGLDLNYQFLYVDVKDKSNVNEINKVINQYAKNYPTSTVYIEKFLQENTMTADFCYMTEFLSLTVCSALALFSIVYLIIYIFLKMDSRKALLGTLRACGLTRKNIYLLMLTENLLVVFGTVVIAVLTSIVICAIPQFALGEMFSFSFYPEMHVLVLSIFYIVSSILACILSVRNHLKNSITDCIGGNL